MKQIEHNTIISKFNKICLPSQTIRTHLESQFYFTYAIDPLFFPLDNIITLAHTIESPIKNALRTNDVAPDSIKKGNQ